MFKRIGYFLIMISFIVLFVFIASYQIDQPDYSLLLLGLALIFLGIFMVIKNRKQTEKADRFRLVRRMRNPRKKNGDEG